jgi:hypothetical protein
MFDPVVDRIALNSALNKGSDVRAPILNKIKKLAATAVAIVAAIAVIVVTTAVVMLTAVTIDAGAAGGDLVLRATDYETGPSIVIHIVDYGLAKKLRILGAHIDLHTPALEDHIILLLIAQCQAVVRACRIYCRQEHPDHFSFYQAAFDHICCRFSDLYH